MMTALKSAGSVIKAPAITDPLPAVKSPILVTGGTGTLGRLVVQQLREHGLEVRVLSRHSRDRADGVEFVTGDLAAGHGIEAAVAGTEIIVHCAGSSKG